MSTLPIDFHWKRALDGYVVRGDRIKPKSRRAEDFRPLDFHAMLYGQFADLDGSAEAFADFMGRFGPVTHAGEFKGESVDDLSGRWLLMRKCIETANADPRDLLRLDAVSPARRGAIRETWDDVNERRTGNRPLKNQPLPVNLAANVTARLRPAPPDGRPTLSLAPDTLWDAMLVQFFQAISAGSRLKVCAYCRGWFETGGASGKRADAKFCSNDCRVRSHLATAKGAK